MNVWIAGAEGMLGSEVVTALQPPDRHTQFSIPVRLNMTGAFLYLTGVTAWKS